MSAQTWFKNNVFHHSRFEDKTRLVELKRKKNVKISLAFPTLNEEKTIAKEILTIKEELQDNYPLLDEIAIIDSGSKDDTCKIAERCGADVYISDDYLKSLGTGQGKGENLWKSLHLLSGDIIVWIDADIANIHPKFAYGVIGPLLENDHIGYVKAFYERPLVLGDRTRAIGGGRVTEIMVRPLLSTFYPELSVFLQPLSGEYAGRREILESIPFQIGYGVEIGLLIDIYNKYGLDCLAQVDLDKRIHRNQSLAALRRMSFAIFHTVISRAVKDGKIALTSEINKKFTHLKAKHHRYIFEDESLSLLERPPMITVEEYQKKHKM